MSPRISRTTVLAIITVFTALIAIVVHSAYWLTEPERPSQFSADESDSVAKSDSVNWTTFTEEYVETQKQAAEKARNRPRSKEEQERIAGVFAWAKQHGLPASIQESMEFRKQADGVDLTQDWLKVLTGAELANENLDIDRIAREFEGVGNFLEDVPATAFRDAQSLVDENAALLDELRELCRKEGYVLYPITFDEDENPGLITLTQDDRRLLKNYKAARDLVTLEARCHAHSGRSQEAIKSLDAALTVVDTVKSDPWAISQAVRQFGYREINTQLQHMLEIQALSSGDYESIRRILNRQSLRESAHLYCVGEFLMNMVMLADSGDEENLLCAIALATGHMAEASKSSYFAPFQVLKDLETDLVSKLTKSKMGIAVPVPGLRKQIYNMFTSGPAMLFTGFVRAEVQRNSLLVAIALTQYRRQHNRLPESMDELVPDFLPQLPVDPIDHEPVRYRFESDGESVRFYSIGFDRKDDDGADDTDDEEHIDPSTGPDFATVIRVRSIYDQ